MEFIVGRALEAPECMRAGAAAGATAAATACPPCAAPEGPAPADEVGVAPQKRQRTPPLRQRDGPYSRPQEPALLDSGKHATAEGPLPSSAPIGCDTLRTALHLPVWSRHDLGVVTAPLTSDAAGMGSAPPACWPGGLPPTGAVAAEVAAELAGLWAGDPALSHWALAAPAASELAVFAHWAGRLRPGTIVAAGGGGGGCRRAATGGPTAGTGALALSEVDALRVLGELQRYPVSLRLLEDSGMAAAVGALAEAGAAYGSGAPGGSAIVGCVPRAVAAAAAATAERWRGAAAAVLSRATSALDASLGGVLAGRCLEDLLSVHNASTSPRSGGASGCASRGAGMAMPSLIGEHADQGAAFDAW